MRQVRGEVRQSTLPTDLGVVSFPCPPPFVAHHASTTTSGTPIMSISGVKLKAPRDSIRASFATFVRAVHTWQASSGHGSTPSTPPRHRLITLSRPVPFIHSLQDIPRGEGEGQLPSLLVFTPCTFHHRPPCRPSIFLLLHLLRMSWNERSLALLFVFRIAALPGSNG